jgi:hypothetical protein
VPLRIITEIETRPSTPLGYPSCTRVHGNEDTGLGYNWQSPQQFPLPQFTAGQRHRISSVTEFKFSLPRTSSFSCFRLFHVWHQKIQRLALSISGPAVTSERPIARPSPRYAPNIRPRRRHFYTSRKSMRLEDSVRNYRLSARTPLRA